MFCVNQSVSQFGETPSPPVPLDKPFADDYTPPRTPRTCRLLVRLKQMVGVPAKPLGQPKAWIYTTFVGKYMVVGGCVGSVVVVA